VKTILLFLPLLITLSFCAQAPKYDLKWYNWTDGIAQVKAKKKPAIVDFYTDWCKWCKVMDEKTFNEKTIKAMLKKDFICMHINPETSKETITFDGKTFKPMEFAQALGVQGFPALVFVDKEGKLITLIPGFIPPEQFIQYLHYIKDECYAKNVKFEDYEKNGGKCK
jgi:thioredoxin-related protein